MTSVLSNVFRVVRSNPTDPDPAHDPTHADNLVADVSERAMTRYVFTRDEQHLRAREGMRFAWFHLRRLPAAWVAEVIDTLSTVSQQRVMALRAALHRVDDPAGEIATTPAADVTAKSAFPCVAHRYGVELAPVDWVQEIADRYGAETVQEMGQIALDHARLPKGRTGPFVYWGGTAATR